MKTDILTNGNVLLKKMTEADANFQYNLYSQPELLKNYDELPVLEGESPQQFTKRIISACEYIWTVRLVDAPDKAIGDCALHHWDKDNAEILIGGALLPEYWGQGIMQTAFELLIGVAKENLKVKKMLGYTKTRNLKAIRLVEKMGFEKVSSDERDTVMQKRLDDNQLVK
ncbi:GNAT family N-acetyltransferase [Rapidithrix thailandica]|uniref:GNAT family N-acetyltransferase n=1 Tax=Rapidithrix thailandica TaxID=413964 RepID=A0AAW9SAC3_9BACT